MSESPSPYILMSPRKNYQQSVVEQSFTTPVLVDFWADWCQPCKTLMPLLAKLAEEYQGKFILAKLDTEQQQELASQFGIRSIPTVKLFKNGQPVDEFAGALPEDQIRQFLDQHIPRESDAAVMQAQQLLQQGEPETALTLLTQAQAGDPANPNIGITLAHTFAMMDDVESAIAVLDKMPEDRQQQDDVTQLREQLDFARMSKDLPDQETLEQRLATDANDSEARLQLATLSITEGNYEQALEHLLTLMAKDRAYEDDAARKTMIKVFDLLGDDPLASRYRSKMMSLIY